MPKKVSKKKETIKKDEVKKIEDKTSIKKSNKKRYIIIASIYFICSILWIVEGYIKYLNKIKPYYFDYITGFLLFLLGVFYIIRIKLDK